MRTSESAVKRLALKRGLPVFQPQHLKDAQVHQRIAAAGPEALVVAAYGLILPKAILGIAPRGALNIHASLLPRWRGAAPIQRALLAGDRETGITIMQMDAGLDTGPILAQQRIAIAPDDDAQTLHDKLAGLGAALIVAALASEPRPTPQDETLASYAKKLDSGDTTSWNDACAR